ncbi:MAG: PQQ-binding-like beta-propeller repeat protein [Bacteroidetes bacterium]|nr:PQQ-binding-like beta-propeller repeat protein [Bacteroidota bacterium]MDA1120962.1 PQQ-binding-like beta-propeller repeat protein [Bacteroidota bacterium]
MNKKTSSVFVWTILQLFLGQCTQPNELYETWSVYRGDQASTAYSSLAQINSKTVGQLQVAWEYHTGDASDGNRSAIQCNPILADGRLYVTSPKLKLTALNPVTGEDIWQFDPFKNKQSSGVNRGVTYWENGDDKRILFSAGPYLYALNAQDGSLLLEFGDNGKIDLRIGLGRDPNKLDVSATSPGIIYKDLIIQGTSLSEGYDAAPGFVRAYNVLTGEIAWTFHTIPQPGEFGYDTWDEEVYQKVGGANAWAGMSLDAKRAIVYVPTGSIAFDFYGGYRKGPNLFANCLLALNAATGERIWHYQLVHHDLWDYDLPSPPTLVTVRHEGKLKEGVAQITKMGMVFLFDRETGEPLFPIEERAVPKSTLLGEESWRTQPFPAKPPPFSRQNFSVEAISDLSPEAHSYISNKVRDVSMGPIFSPPDTRGVVQFPGTRGGGEWGGPAFDPETGILYVNANEIPMLIKMKPIELPGAESPLPDGEYIYALNSCATCHGANREGNGVFPSLVGVSEKLTENEVMQELRTGKGQMPAFPNLSEEEKEALVSFLFNETKNSNQNNGTENTSSPRFRYVHDGWNVLLDSLGYPGVKPPWGTLNAIDLNQGEIKWSIPLGEYPELMEKGLPATGTHNLGGPIVTAGGLVFIGATRDEKIRAFDKETGRQVWEYKLPAGGYATPTTFEIKGRQFLVIAAGGGGKVGSPSGDSYIAFVLPD